LDVYILAEELSETVANQKWPPNIGKYYLDPSINQSRTLKSVQQFSL